MAILRNPLRWSAVPTGLLFILTVAMAPASADELSEITGLIERSDWSSAEMRIRSMLDRHPDYAYGHSLLGHVLMREGRLTAAETSHRRAVNLGPDRYGFHHELARVHFQAERFDRVIEILREAPEPTEPSAVRRRHLLLGRALAGSGQTAAAIEVLERARGAGTDPALAERLAVLRVEQGELALAISLLGEAIDERPSRGLHLRRLTLQLRYAGEQRDPELKTRLYREALAAADVALEEHPADPDIRNQAGRAALGARDFERARHELTQVLDADPSRCFPMLNLMKVEIGVQDWAAAESWGERAAACDETQVHVHRQLGFVLEKQDRLEESLDAYGRALDIDPDVASVTAVERILHNLEVRRHNRELDDIERQDGIDLEKWLRQQRDLEEKIRQWNRKHGTGDATTTVPADVPPPRRPTPGRAKPESRKELPTKPTPA